MKKRCVFSGSPDYLPQSGVDSTTRRIARLAPLLLTFAVACIGRNVFAADSSEIETCISSAKKYLYSQQQKNGTWETVDAPKPTPDGNDTAGPQWGGLTSLCVYALLAAGDNPQDPKLSPAIEFLKKAKIVGTYALGVRCQVWLLLPQSSETRSLIRKDAAALEALMKRTKGSPAFGFYDYDGTRGPNSYSLSRSQYAVLGVWAAAQMAVEIPNEYWQTVETAWVNAQDKSGGWRYQNSGKGNYPLTPGITAVGVATLYITQEYLTSGNGKVCKGNIANPAIDRGLKWMADHFDAVATSERYERSYPFATLYAVERIGVASGRKFIGKDDWFKKGSDFLIKEQRKDGYWSGGWGKVPDTCFGLLFLVRGRAPVVMNKLEYTQSDAAEADWNQRPRDAANLSRWIGRRFERDLNWQVVNAEAPLADWHDAPILYISGTKDLKLDDAAKAKLKGFIQEGGLVLGNADCGGRGFANGFKKLATSLFPSYEMRELPADHPIYHGVFPRDKWKSKPSVLGLSNGVRELMLLIPQTDAGRIWQSQEVSGKEEPWQLGADIFLYVADQRNLRYRGESSWIDLDPAIKPKTKFEVTRLKYDGNWDPEPGGWRRLSNVVRNQQKLELSVNDAAITAQSLKDVKLAHLTGTAAFKLSDAARAALTAYLKSGGTLVIDAAGGSSVFAKSAEAEIAAIAPTGKTAILPPEHPLFAAGGTKVEAFKYRAPAGKPNAASRMPHLQGVTVDNRLAILYSTDDLSAGLVGQAVEGVVGYDPATATDIMSRIILYTAGNARESHPN